MLHLVHQCTHIVGHRIHAEGVQTTVEHVRLDASLMERLAESTHGLVRILTREELYLLEGAAIGLYT